MFFVTLLVISVVGAAMDEMSDPAQNDTVLALPMHGLPNNDYLMSSSPTASDLTDYQAFQRFKYLVYPNKFAVTSNNQHDSASMVAAEFARNITIDEIQVPTTSGHHDRPAVNNMFLRRADHTPQSLESRHHYASMPADYQHEHHHLMHPSSTGPAVLMYGITGPHQANSFPSHMHNGMAHMADPLFVMATLAFVAFLINSILGLVDRLNLLPLVRTTTKRRGKLEPVATDHRVLWPERRDGEQSEEGVEALLRQLETTIRAAFEHYERCATNPNECDHKPTVTNR